MLCSHEISTMIKLKEINFLISALYVIFSVILLPGNGFSEVLASCGMLVTGVGVKDG